MFFTLWKYQTGYRKILFFDKAVLSMLPVIGFQPDIIHCHDWETGLIPVYLKNEFQGDMFFWGMKSVMTIHNLKFQGVWDIKTMQGLTGLPASLFTPDKLEYKKDANMLRVVWFMQTTLPQSVILMPMRFRQNIMGKV